MINVTPSTKGRIACRNGRWDSLRINVVPAFAEQAKVVLSGEIRKAVTLKGVGATKGARAAIEAAGGKLEA